MAEIDPYLISTYQRLAGQQSNEDTQTLADVALKRSQNRAAQYQLGRQQNLASIVSQNAGAFSNPYAQALAQGGYGQEAYEAQNRAIEMGQVILNIHRSLTSSRLSAAQTPEQRDAVLSSMPDDVRQLYGAPASDAKPEEKAVWAKNFIAGQLTPEQQAQLNKDRYSVVDAAGIPVRVDKTTGDVVTIPGVTDSSTLSGPALDSAARQFLQSGEMPELGRDPGSRLHRAIMQRAEELAPGSNIAANRATYAADKASLEHLQPQVDAVSSFIRTFDKNLKMLEKSAAKLKSTNSPALNKGLRWYQTTVSGDPNLTAFKQALSAVTSEAGKINSGSTGQGGVPISVLEEMERNLPENATPDQIVGALKVLRQDSENRRAAMREQLGEIKSRFQTAAPKAKPAASVPRKLPPGITHIRTVKGETRGWNGKAWVKIGENNG